MMDITIYQINHDRDTDRVSFMGYDDLPQFQGSQEPNPEIYDKVFEGSVDCSNLEDVYEKFNLDHPAEFQGHSLSVSDIVEIKAAPDTEPGFYFCDSFGFKQIPFEPVQSQEASKTIKVVLLEPGKLARTADIGSSLEGMQRVVGGDIEAYYPFEEQVCVVCNDEGKINGMPLNRAVYGENREMLDIIAGTCFICDCRGENFGSLSDEQLSRFSKQFKYPERFFRVNDEIKAIPYKPEKENER
jgi:hypothetical protein